MPVIDSTPEFVANAYTIMRNNLEIVRPRLGRPLGLADKLVLSHLDDPENQELEAGKSYLLARPDRVILQDVLGQTAMLVFMQWLRWLILISKRLLIVIRFAMHLIII